MGEFYSQLSKMHSRGGGGRREEGIIYSIVAWRLLTYFIRGEGKVSEEGSK